MKSSPLRLRWVTYPAASYEPVEDFQGDVSAPIAADVDAEVKFAEVGEHLVYLRVTSKEAEGAPYRFSVTAVAGFEFDLEIARREYKPNTTPGLVPMISVNVARIVYAGAREFLAMMTSRASFGTAVLDSTLLEPNDVRVNSDILPMDVLRVVFKATEEEIAELQNRMKRNQDARGAAALETDVPKRSAATVKKRRAKTAS